MPRCLPPTSGLRDGLADGRGSRRGLRQLPQADQVRQTNSPVQDFARRPLLSTLLDPGQVRAQDGRQGHREQPEGGSSSNDTSSRYRCALETVEERSLHSDLDRIQLEEPRIEEFVQHTSKSFSVKFN